MSNKTAFGDVYDRLAALSVLVNGINTRVSALETVSLPPNPLRNLTLDTKSATSLKILWDGPASGTFTNSILVYNDNVNEIPDTSDTTFLSKISQTIQAGVFTADITGLTPGTTYYIFLYAENSAGYSTALTQSFITFALPNPVTNFTIGTIGRFSVESLSWESPTNIGSNVSWTTTRIILSTTNIPPTDPSDSMSLTSPFIHEDVDHYVLAKILNNLSEGTTYYVWIYAYGVYGYSAPVATSFRTISLYPMPVNDLELEILSDTSIKLTWSLSVTGGGVIDIIRIYTRSGTAAATEPGINDSDYSTATSASTEITLSSLSNDTSYTFYVYAYNDTHGRSIKSEVSHTTAPAEPTDLLCYQIAEFNTTSNVWDVTGNQPTNPFTNGTSEFDNNTCQWVQTSPDPPDP